MKPTKPITRTLTQEEQQEQQRKQALQFFARQRENFSLSILTALCHTVNSKTNLATLVDEAVEMADKLMEKLYAPKED